MVRLFLVSAIACLGLSVSASDITTATALYSERDYTIQGLIKAQQAADLFGELAQSTVGEEKADLLTRQSEGLFFIGTALTDLDENANRDQAIANHLNGLGVSTQSAILIMQKALGSAFTGEKESLAKSLSTSQIKALRKDLNETQKDQLALALYQRAANYGSWIQLVRASESSVTLAGAAKEVIATAELMSRMGRSSAYYQAPDRVIGRMKAQASAAEALLLGFGLHPLSSGIEDHLVPAVKATTWPNSTVSLFGSNNVYLAEALVKAERKSEAKEFLQTWISLISQTPDILPDLIPENARAKHQAEKILADLE